MGRSEEDPTEGGGAPTKSKRGRLEESGTRQAVAKAQPGLLLIVEDMPVVASSHQRAARRMGARSHVESTADGALAFLEKSDVSGMLVDVNLGDGGNGLDFLRRAREDLERFTTALVFSGLSDDQLILAPCRLGALFRAKPGDGAELRRFFRMVARWPTYDDRLNHIFDYFDKSRDPSLRLTEWHRLLIQQYLFFGTESIDERLGVSRGTRKRLQKPLLDALRIETLSEIWEVLSLVEGASDVSIRNLLGGV
jgi:ActR/RegA family two-component response regulator